MARLKLQFDAWQELGENLDKLGGDLRATTEEALKKSHAAITPGIAASFGKHNDSGTMMGTLREESKVEWEGLTASIPIGFDIGAGGVASVFLMYGTPRMSPDRKTYNAIYGAKVKKQINEIQKEVFTKAIERAMR